MLIANFLIALLARSDPSNDFVVVGVVRVKFLFPIYSISSSYDISGYVWTRLGTSGHVCRIVSNFMNKFETFEHLKNLEFRVLRELKELS